MSAEYEVTVYTRDFLARLAKATTKDDLRRLADGSRLKQTDPRDRLHHWLGCALHGNPYDGAPAEVGAAIAAALARVGGL